MHARCRYCSRMIQYWLLIMHEECLKHNFTALQEAVRERNLGINWGNQTLVVSRELMECNI